MTAELEEVQNLDIERDQKLNDFMGLFTYQVVDQNTYDYAVLSVKNGREFIKEVEDVFAPGIANLYRPYKALLDEKNKYIKPTDEAIKYLSTASIKWQREEKQRIEKTHQLKLAADNKREQLRLEEAKKKAEAEFDIFADPIPAAPEPLIPVQLVVQAPPPKVSTPLGMGIKESPLKWRWKNQEEQGKNPGMVEFMKACLENPHLLDYVGELLDPKIVKGVISSRGEDAVKMIPGIELFRSEILARR